MLISEKYNLICDLIVSDEVSEKVLNILDFREKELSEKKYLSMVLIKNPYQRVLDFYMSTVLSRITPIFKDKKKEYVEHFRKWINKMFIHEKLVLKLTYENTVEKYSKVLNEFKLSNLDYDFFIREENLLLDLNKIDNNLNVPNIQVEQRWKVEEFYDFVTAKVVFNFYKNEFFVGEYDPFLFSLENLNKEDKVKFVHEPF